ncbi:alpha-ketoglutarate-dependent dioxygenase AlkB [uncultured Chitinophaga sp.]|jgi:Alkylated DNA repair protein|uniref:alpha-ketoglutarate-dependent dioxygenase AlkB family protein n=1 Tax=uncultured Chitinophaga sp. TaxID=339340 RepID=UPI00260EAFB5|nr:alpha-ketoglutarate-dependent dioxygenase AlkB [uncultured Chitinophaga sp.]
MNQQLFVFPEDDAPHKVLLKDGALEYYPHFFTIPEADRLLQQLLKKIDWKQESMNMYGKQVLFPRLMAWHGDAGSTYAFSGKTYSPQPWTPPLPEIRQRIEPVAGVQFNSVLLNLYRDGKDAMGWHADDEPELGLNPLIASVNLGATRRFMLRYKSDHRLKYELELQHGSLLIMKGTIQHYWQHQVPKTSRPLPSRINLTFRVIKA